MAKALVRRLSLLAGRKNLYWASHFLIRTARGDVRNDYAFNGERIVQGVALRTAVAPATVFDVGANKGDWTAGLLEISGNLRVPAHVHAFEPSRDTFNQLSSRYGSSPNVALINQACARSPGTALLRVYESAGGTNSLADPIDEREAESEEVQVTTVDLYCDAAGVESIDLLKIDAEGYDFEVIAGASRMLDKKAIRILQFEYNHRWIGARNYLKDVFSFLAPKGYAIGKMMGDRVEFYPYWQWELETWDEGNYVSCPLSDVVNFHRREPSWLFFGPPQLQRLDNE